MTKLFQLRKGLILAAASLAFAAVFGIADPAKADHRSHNLYSNYRGQSYGYRSGPIYHGPSVHYDTYYHHEYSHWTPWSGWHSHGHYDTVPHYTPGHFDYQHGNHIHGNPWFH